MANEPETNFLKIILLLMRYGSTVLQHRIEYELRIRKWQTVTDFLKERKHDIILHLTLDKNRKCCIKNCKIQTASKRLIPTSLSELMYEVAYQGSFTAVLVTLPPNLTWTSVFGI